MRKLLDQIIVVDVESTCWARTPPAGQESEIIEVGVCMVDIATAHRVTRESILVKPERSTVGRFCTRLTSLTQEQVDEGASFRAACDILRSRYCSEQRVWASYGDYDRRQFERECRSQRVDYPFGSTHINVKNLLAVIYGLPREVGMARAMELLILPLEGVHHRGGDDAWNIGAILSRLLLDRRLAAGRVSRTEE